MDVKKGSEDTSGFGATLPDECTAPKQTIDAKELAIIEAARQSFLAKGFDAASMDEIALLANVSKRTVYNRFRSKEALFAAAILTTCQEILPDNFAELEAHLPPYDLLETLARRFVEGVFSPEAIALRRIAAFEAQRRPELGKAFLDNGPRMMVKTCVPILKRLAEKANIAVGKEDDFEAALWQLGALLTEPLHTHVLMGQVPDDLDEQIDRQIQNGLMAFLKLHKVK
ncbi:MAG: TetR/AcrR family transcriptional regulator [Pseudomonadota bacterium]